MRVGGVYVAVRVRMLMLRKFADAMTLTGAAED